MRRTEVGISLGGGQLSVAQEVFDGVEADAGHDQEAGEGMAEIMKAAVEPGSDRRAVEVVGNGVCSPGEQAAHLGESRQDRFQGRGDPD